MHRGVRDFMSWVEDHRGELQLEAPASAETLASLEQQLGVPLPADLRFVLQRYNGGELPSGHLLPAGIGPGTIEAAVRDLAERLGADFLDPELLLPFHRTNEGSLLAFDRSAGPVSDTWPIVDYFEETGEVRLVHRTFDGWCRACVDEWAADDFEADFSLDKYLRMGARHVQVEPDVASAHATVAHALKRAGEPDKALVAYLEAARCVPTLPWCDWEAFKLSVLLERPKEALESAQRLCSPAPLQRWAERETTPARVADLVGRMARRAPDAHWTRLLDLLVHEALPDEIEHVRAVRAAVVEGGSLPHPLHMRSSIAPPGEQAAGGAATTVDVEHWWQAVQAGYAAGQVRDEDLLFDPQLGPLSQEKPFSDLLRIRREF